MDILHTRHRLETCPLKIRAKKVAKLLESENNPWTLDENGDLRLLRKTVDSENRVCSCRMIYWIPVEEITDQEVPDWLAQVSEKTWATLPIIGGLCRAFELLVGYRGKRLVPRPGPSKGDVIH